MKTFAVVVFIAGVAAVAIMLATTPTVASGTVMEVELLAIIRPQGAVGVTCEPRIPIGRNGAQFQCTALLGGGMEQAIACELDREGKLTVKPAGAPEPSAPAAGTRRAIPPSGDPWAN